MTGCGTATYVDPDSYQAAFPGATANLAVTGCDQEFAVRGVRHSVSRPGPVLDAFEELPCGHGVKLQAPVAVPGLPPRPYGAAPARTADSWDCAVRW